MRVDAAVAVIAIGTTTDRSTFPGVVTVGAETVVEV